MSQVPTTESSGHTHDVDAGAPPANLAHAEVRVVVVDNEKAIREILSDFLQMEGYVVATAADGVAALALLDRRPEGVEYEVVLTDLIMPGMGGIDLLSALRDRFPDVAPILMTGFGTVETAIMAMKLGAVDYVLKPFSMHHVLATIERCLVQRRLASENIELRAALSLFRLAARLGDEVELVPTLRLVAETVREQTGADAVSVLLFPDEDFNWTGERLGNLAPNLSDLSAEARTLDAAVLAEDGRVFRYLRHGERTDGLRGLLMTPLVSKGRRLGILLATRGQGHFVEGDRKLLTIIADRAAVAVQNAQLFETLERTFTHTVEAFVTALEEKDTYTAGHSERVAEFALATARELGLDAEQCRLVHQGGRLHDIGKISLHADDLNKAGPLTAEEYARFKEHPAIGEALMRPIPTFRDVLPAIGAHHERWDGAGYPRGLAGEDIPFIARIMAVADTYDAMTSNRAYRAALKHSVALAEIRRCSGSQFDPKVVDAFLAAIETWRERRKREGLDYPR